jgi:hypothetical protein
MPLSGTRDDCGNPSRDLGLGVFFCVADGMDADVCQIVSYICVKSRYPSPSTYLSRMCETVWHTPPVSGVAR